MDGETLDPPVEQAGEASLADRARAGDETAWTAIVERYLRDVWNLSRRIVRNDHAADDVTQETFRVVREKLAEYRGQGTLCGWIKAICRRQALDELRRRDRQAREVPIEDWHLSVRRGPPTEDRWVQHIDLERALSLLEYDEREALLATEAGYRSEELAQVLGIAATTVRSRRARARARMLRELDDGYGRRTQ
jgi:RNA polymerase sigma-70 factor (ECF subfamily)